MENVRDYFPDIQIPDQCLRCPALESAAHVLEFNANLAAHSAGRALDQELDPSVQSSDEDADDLARRIANVADFTASHAEQRGGPIRQIAEELVANCVDGALDDYRRERRAGPMPFAHRQVAIITRQCRSTHPLQAFIPTLYTELGK